MRKATIVGKHADNGQIIFRARRRRGISQVALGEQAGISHRQIVRLENGEHLPSREHRDKLAEALGLDPAAIRSNDDGSEAADGEPFRHGNGSRGGSARTRKSASARKAGLKDAA